MGIINHFIKQNNHITDEIFNLRGSYTLAPMGATSSIHSRPTQHLVMTILYMHSLRLKHIVKEKIIGMVINRNIMYRSEGSS